MKRFVRILEWFLGIIFGFFGLVALVGWIGDMTAMPELKRYQAETKEMVEEYREKGFRRKVIDGTPKSGNAWDYYSKALEVLNEPDRTGLDEIRSKTNFRHYFDLGITSFADLNANEVDCLKEGAQREYCNIPIEYETADPMRLMQISEALNLSLLGVLSGNQKLMQRQPRKAAKVYLQSFCFSEDIASGSIILFGRMIALNCMTPICKAIRVGLETNQFDEEELAFLAQELLELEETFPKMSTSLEFETMGIVYPRIAGLYQYMCAFFAM